MGDQWGLDKEATIFRGLHPAQGTRQEWEGREGGGIGTAGGFQTLPGSRERSE